MTFISVVQGVPKVTKANDLLITLFINDLSAFEWIDVEDFLMQLINFKASLLWALKFDDLRKLLETAMPKKFDCLKKMAIALLSIFGSTYLCERIFSHTKFMKFILSSHCSRLTENHSEACVQLKVTRCSPNITELS